MSGYACFSACMKYSRALLTEYLHGGASTLCGNHTAHRENRQKEKGTEDFFCTLLNSSLVGARRFELPTPCTPCKYATRLRYAPNRQTLYQCLLSFDTGFMMGAYKKRHIRLPEIIYFLWQNPDRVSQVAIGSSGDFLIRKNDTIHLFRVLRMPYRRPASALFQRCRWTLLQHRARVLHSPCHMP